MAAILSATHVGKSFQQGESTLHVLRDVNLDVQGGETISIVGPSGAGKSTLLALLAALDLPSSGSIRLGTSDIAGLSEKELSRLRAGWLGMVFQQYHLIPTLTARENVSLPMEILGHVSPWDKAAELLGRVGLSARINHYPRQLSGGECQRVAIARALAPAPRLVLADEPTGNLDADNAEAVTKLLFDAVGEAGAALVIVTHNLQLAERCSRRLTLRGGVLQEAGHS